MDHRVQISTYRETLLSPVHNTEQIGITDVMLPMVQPIVNDINKDVHIILENGTQLTLTTPVAAAPTLAQLAQTFQGGDWSTQIDGHTLTITNSSHAWKFERNHSIWGGASLEYATSHTVAPAINPPHIYMAIGDDQGWWRGQLNTTHHKFGVDVEPGMWFLGSMSTHGFGVHEWPYEKKTVRELVVEFKWEHDGKLWDYDFLGKTWFINVTIHGEVDRRKTHDKPDPEISNEPTVVPEKPWWRSLGGQREVLLAIIVILAAFTLSRSRRTLAASPASGLASPSSGA